MSLTMFYDTGYEKFPLSKEKLLSGLVETKKPIELITFSFHGKEEKVITDKNEIQRIVSEESYLDVYEDSDRIQILFYPFHERPNEWVCHVGICGDCANNCGGACMYDIPLEARCLGVRLSDIYGPTHCEFLEPRDEDMD